MTDHDALWSAVRKVPDDALRHQVYADWHEENGDPLLAAHHRQLAEEVRDPSKGLLAERDLPNLQFPTSRPVAAWAPAVSHFGGRTFSGIPLVEARLANHTTPYPPQAWERSHIALWRLDGTPTTFVPVSGRAEELMRETPVNIRKLHEELLSNDDYRNWVDWYLKEHLRRK